MYYYKLRIDIIDALDVALYRTMESKYFISYVRSEESVNGENKHYHYYVESLTKSATIRNYIRTYIGKGNGVYTLGNLDEEKPMEYLSYICKDGNAIFYNIDIKLQQDVLAYSVRVNDEIKEKKRKKRLSDRQEIFKYLDENLPEFPKPEDVCLLIVNWYVEHEKIIRYFYIKNLVETYLCSKDATFKLNFVRKLINDIR